VISRPPCSRGPDLNPLVSPPYGEVPGEADATAPGEGTHARSKTIPDPIVDDDVIVDSKVVESFNKDHFAQMLGYLAISGLELALPVNFKYASLQRKRVVKSGLEANDESVL
jgi:hypothetical protein